MIACPDVDGDTQFLKQQKIKNLVEIYLPAGSVSPNAVNGDHR